MSTQFFRATALPRDGAIRLFCFPYAGGSGAAIYRQWQQHAPRWLQICPVELPGRGWLCTEAPFRSLPELAAEITSALYAYTDTPCALFGHSMGALIAYEVACNLEAAGKKQLRKLIASGARAPFLARMRPPVSNLPAPEFLAHVRDMNGTPAEVLADGELMEALLPVLRADFSMCEQYRIGRPLLLRAPITTLAGLEDEEITEPDVRAWKQLTSGAFRCLWFPGDHFYIRENMTSIVNAISDELSPAAAFARLSGGPNVD